MSVIIHKRKGHSIPQAFLKKALEKNPTVAGISVGTGDEVLNIHFEASETEGGLLAALLGAQERLTDHDAVICIASMDTGYNSDDVQPFGVLVTGDDPPQTLLSAFMYGEFPSFDPVEGHDLNRSVLEEHLIEQFGKYYTDAGNDIDAFMTSLETNKSIGRYVQGAFGDTGVITMIGYNGAIRSFEKGLPSTSEFPWGWVSDTLGYTEVPLAKPQGVVDKLANLASKLGGGRKAPGATPAPQPEVKEPEVKTDMDEHLKPKVDKGPNIGDQQTSGRTAPGAGKPSVPQVKQNATSSVALNSREEVEGELLYPPENIKRPADLKEWYRGILGKSNLPHDYKKRPGVRRPKAKVPGATAKDFTEMATKIDPTALKDVNPKAVKPEHALPLAKSNPEGIHTVSEKVTLPITTEARKVQDANAAAAGKLPIIEAKAQRALLDEFLKKPDVMKHIGLGTEGVDTSPEAIQALEERYASFTETLGISLEDTYSWAWKDLLEMCTKHPGGAALFIRQFMLIEIKKLAQAKNNTEKKNDPTATPVAAQGRPAAGGRRAPGAKVA